MWPQIYLRLCEIYYEIRLYEVDVFYIIDKGETRAHKLKKDFAESQLEKGLLRMHKQNDNACRSESLMKTFRLRTSLKPQGYHLIIFVQFQKMAEEDIKKQLAEKTAEAASLKEDLSNKAAEVTSLQTQCDELRQKLEQVLKLAGDGKEDLLAKIPGGLGGMLGAESKEEEKPADAAKEAAEDAADAAKTALASIF